MLLFGIAVFLIASVLCGLAWSMPIMTAYRQQAIATALAQGPLRPRDLKETAPNAGATLRNNYYGWFEKVEKGVYALSVTGREAINALPVKD